MPAEPVLCANVRPVFRRDQHGGFRKVLRRWPRVHNQPLVDSTDAAEETELEE